MKLHIENVFDATPQELWDLFNSKEFEDRLEETSGVRMTTLEENIEGDVEERRIECKSKKELPGFMAKVLGAKHLTYTQINKLDRSKDKLWWQVIPMAMSDKVTAEGTTVVTAEGDQSRRVVSGEISVRIPLIGGRIEKVILGEVEASYQRAAELAESLIAEQKKG